MMTSLRSKHVEVYSLLYKCIGRCVLFVVFLFVRSKSFVYSLVSSFEMVNLIYSARGWLAGCGKSLVNAYKRMQLQRHLRAVGVGP